MVDALVAVVPSVVTGLSAYWLYRTGDKNGQRQIDAEDQRLNRELQRDSQRIDREELVAAIAHKRARYEAFLEASHEFSAFLISADARSVHLASGMPDKVPAELVQKLSAGTSGALLEAPEELADKILKIHDELIMQMDMQGRDGGGYATGRVDDSEMATIREQMRADLSA